MKCLIAKIKNRSRKITYRKIISDKTIYNKPNNLKAAVAYNPATLLDEDTWYKIENFSTMEYCQEIMKSEFSSVDYDRLDKREIEIIDYLCSYQEGIFYFQNISKSNLQPKNWIHMGDDYEYVEGGKVININKNADAIYVQESDVLYFTNLSKITGIFKGISELYREATDEETASFLNNSFIELANDFSASNVKTANRKRIALAVDVLSKFNSNEKKKVFKYINEYCPNLKSQNGSFSIGSEEELKQLLWGIEQRYYTTPVGKEKRLANSIITLN